MKKFLLFGLSMVLALSFSSCKSTKQSQYKAAYDQAKQQELAEGQGQVAEPIEIAPVTTTAREQFKAAHRNDADFQKAWLLYNR